MKAVLARLLTAGLVAAGLTVVAGPATPAHAAACAPGTGVTVVVNTDVRCDPGPGGNARAHFTSGVGHAFEDARRFPGFVCRINGFPGPAQDRCIDASPADAYWSLWWSDGRNGRWVYSQLGVNSLTIPDGGWVAFRWNTGGGRQEPPVRPTVTATSGGGSGSSDGSVSGSSSAGGSAGDSSSSGGTASGGAAQERAEEKAATAEKAAKKEKAEKEREAAAKEEAEQEGEASPSPEATTDTVDAQSADATDGSLGTVAIVIVVLALGAIGGFLAWRRRPGRDPS